MSQTVAAERIESLKAGALAAIATVGLYALTVPAQGLAIAHAFDGTVAVWVRGAIAALTGFLFGVTYRYTIRQDANPQLKAGAVMAFALVRGLAQVDVEFTPNYSLQALSWHLLESCLLFIAAVAVLDWAMRRGWVKPFGSP